MSNYLVTDTDMTSVADAIRTKGGTSASLAFPTGFVNAINDIPSGGGGGDFEVHNVTITTDKADFFGLPVVNDENAYPPNMIECNVYIASNTPTTLPLLFYKGKCYTALDDSMWSMSGAVDFDYECYRWYFTGEGSVTMNYD